MKRVSFLVLILVALLTLSTFNLVHLQPSVKAALSWTINIVDNSSSDVGHGSSIALDSYGNPHISYIDFASDSLKYASWTGSTWATETVVGPGANVKYNTASLVFDGTVPHIGYSDGNLKYATKVGTSWSTQLVDSADSEDGRWCSLKLDSSGYPHICYVAGTGDVDVKYASWTGSTWDTAYLATSGYSAFEFTSLALDSNGKPHACWFHNYFGTVSYANKTGASWGSPVSVASGLAPSAGDCSIALDSHDRPSISYYYETMGDVDHGWLELASWTGTTWSTQTVDSPRAGYSEWVGQSNSLFIDYMDNPHISYYDTWVVGASGNAHTLKYARWTGTAWSTETADPAWGEWYEATSLVVSTEGVVHISYYDYANQRLKYATTTIPNFVSKEYFFQVWLDALDTDGDGKNDTIQVSVDVDSTYAGTQRVWLWAFLTYPNGTGCAMGVTSWYITDAAYDYGYITLYTPLGYGGAAGGSWCNVVFYLADNGGHLENQTTYNNVAYLYPPASTSGYSATIWSWDVEGWIAEPITMDGVPTGYSTPHTFTLTGTHTFAVPGTDVLGYPFDRWSTGELTTTITVTSGGTYTAEYRPASTILVVRGMDNHVYYRVCSGGAWDIWNVVPNGATCDSPAAAVLGNSLFMVVRGMDGNSLWYGSIDLTSKAFSGWTQLSGATNSAPTLTSNGTALCLIVRGLDNRIYLRCYTSGAWGSWHALSKGATGGAPAAVLVGSNLHLIVRGMDGNSLWYGQVTCDGQFISDWTLNPGATASRPALAYSPEISYYPLCLTVRGLDNKVYLQAGEPWKALPGATIDGPGAAASSDGTLHIVVRGIDGNTLWYGYYNLYYQIFSGWTLLSGATPSAPTLTN